MAELTKMTRAGALDYIEECINTLYDKRALIDAEITALVGVSAMLKEPAPAKSFPAFVWVVPSRSGGTPHYVSVDQSNQYDCTCEARKGDKWCWAMSGIREYRMYHKSSSFGTFVFLDPKYHEYHTATRLSE